MILLSLAETLYLSQCGSQTASPLTRKDSKLYPWIAREMDSKANKEPAKGLTEMDVVSKGDVLNREGLEATIVKLVFVLTSLSKFLTANI